MEVGEGEGGLRVVRDEYHTLDVRVFTVEGAYESIELDTKRAIDIVTRLPHKLHGRGGKSAKPGRHRFVPKVGTEEHMMEFLKSCTVGKKK